MHNIFSFSATRLERLFLLNLNGIITFAQKNIVVKMLQRGAARPDRLGNDAATNYERGQGGRGEGGREGSWEGGREERKEGGREVGKEGERG